MPTDEAYQAVLAELAKLGDAWRAHRETINRAVGMLADEVFGFEKRLDRDDQDRRERQKELDAKLQSIFDGQAQIQRWQRLRVTVEIIAIVVVVAYLIGVSR